MADVFVSYKVSPGTSALVRRIADELEGMGISCWYAPRNTDPGAFVPSILQAIDRCKIFLMILDEGANSSGYVFNETVEAFDRYKKERQPLIMPFKIGLFQVARELNFYLRPFHIINGGASPETADTSELIRKTAALFHKSPQLPPDIAARLTVSAAPPKVAQPEFQPVPQAPPPAKIIKRGECGDKGDNVTFTLDENGVLTLSGNGAMRDFYWDFATKTRNIPWWHERKMIYSVQIQYGVTVIGRAAFNDCVELTSASIPESVITIRYKAFNGCSNLKSIVIPNSVTSIQETAFEYSGLTSVVVPEQAEVSLHAFPAIVRIERRRT